MRSEKVAFADVHSFSSFFLDYLNQQKALRPFYSHSPDLDNFAAQMTAKSTFPKNQRELLVDELKKQYASSECSETVKQNIASLSSDRTFTVTTGHQLNIFTGPLYFIYKIVTAINACRQLARTYPGYHFVPVYWMASEDHDFEEISYFNLYGKTYTWQTDQTGAVGRFNPKSIVQLMKEIPGDTKLFAKAYGEHDTLSDAVRYYVNQLFGSEGLVVIDADRRSFKKTISRVIHDDLFDHTIRKHIDATDAKLRAQRFEPAVHPRDINFFYLDQGIRSRIERTDDLFGVVDTAIRFSKSQIETMMEVEPEKFSPNVVLRPLYQEMILPNLAYVGGPAELVYWLQLKGVFDHYLTPFPILLPRNFALVIDGATNRKFQKTDLKIKDLFDDKNTLFNRWVQKHSTHPLALAASIKKVRAIFDQVKSTATAIDGTLGALVDAESTKTIQRFEKVEKKMLKAEKRRHADKLRQIEAVKDALFPGGGLQERSDNFLGFYQTDPAFIQKIIGHFDAFDFRFNVLLSDD